MPNTTTGLFETRVIPAAVSAIQSLRFTCAATESIFWDYRAEGGDIGQTMNANIPYVNEGDAQDIGSGPIKTSDTDHATVAIVLDQHPSVSFTIRSWDKVRTAEDLQRLYVQPKLEALKRKINRLICNLVTSTNFNAYTVITGGADTFSRANLAGAWSNLVSSGVPVTSPDDVSFVTHPSPYGNMLADTSFYQMYVVGQDAAVAAQQRAILAPQVNALVKFDQQFPQPAAGTYAALYFHKFAIGGVCVDPPSLAGTAGGVEETTIFPFPGAPRLPVQLQMQGSLKDQGTVIHMHAMLGVKVVRPDHGAYLVST